MKYEYKIYATLHEDINSGWVWINNPKSESQKLKQRAVVCISNSVTRKKVYCEILQIDANFQYLYNMGIRTKNMDLDDTPKLVMNEWYRKRLGDNVETQSTYELQVIPVDNLYGKFKSCFHHPQVIVRVATCLGIISVIEGLIGFGLGLASLCK